MAASVVPSRETPLATLGDRVIREADFQGYLARTHPPEQIEEIRRSPSARQSALHEYLDLLAMVAKARREGIDRELRFKKALQLMEMKVLSQLVTERHRDRFHAASQVSPEEVKAYYVWHRAKLTEVPRFTAHHLLVYVKGNPAFPEKGLADGQARARAERALAALRAGASWEAVARTYSDEVPTNQHAGLIRDGQFGYFAPEVERAVRSQALGRPGEVVKSAFGYHVLQVVERILEGTPRPFDEVKGMITERLARAKSEKARKAFLAPIAEEVGLRWREAGKRDASLLDEKAVAPGEVLAEVGGRRIREEDFRWFLEDALMPEQRTAAYARPGARRGMLRSFLDMLALEAKARKDGLDRTPEFARRRASMEESLLSEFVQSRDNAGAFCRCQQTDEERLAARRAYSKRVRAEVGLEVRS